MKQKNLFARIVKIDAATRTVTGIAMQEVVDRTNEKCLYEESKPFFKAWSSTQEAATNGKSKGNIRVMHTSKVAGIVTELVCDDQQKAFIVTSQIIDDDEWKMVEAGGYSGYSIGANFAKDAAGNKIAKKVNGTLEWAADPVEISLVDIPCVPTALFEHKDAAGHVEMRKFNVPEKRKSMYTISEMAYVLSSIQYLMQDLEYEAEYENDGSKVPARIGDWLLEGVELFQDVVAEETSEFAQRFTAAKAAVVADRAKKASGCGCDCSGCADCGKKKAVQVEPQETEDMTAEQTKAFDEGIATLKSIAPTLEALKGVPGAVAEMKTSVDAIDTRLKAVESQSAEMKEFADGMAALEKAFGEQPAQSKTVHPVVPREPEQAKAAEPQISDKPLTDSSADKAKRVEGFKALYAQGWNPGY